MKTVCDVLGVARSVSVASRPSGETDLNRPGIELTPRSWTVGS